MNQNTSAAEKVTAPLARFESGVTHHVADDVHDTIMHVVQQRILAASKIQPVFVSKSTRRVGWLRRPETTRVHRRSRVMHTVTNPDAFSTGHNMLEVADEVITVQYGRRGRKGTAKPNVIGNTVTLVSTKDVNYIGLVAVRRDGYQISDLDPEVKTWTDLLTPVYASEPGGANQSLQAHIDVAPHETRKTEALRSVETDHRSHTQRLVSMLGLLTAAEDSIIAFKDNVAVEHRYLDLVVHPDIARVNGQRLALTTPSTAHLHAGKHERPITLAPIPLAIEAAPAVHAAIVAPSATPPDMLM